MLHTIRPNRSQLTWPLTSDPWPLTSVLPGMGEVSEINIQECGELLQDKLSLRHGQNPEKHTHDYARNSWDFLALHKHVNSLSTHMLIVNCGEYVYYMILMDTLVSSAVTFRSAEVLQEASVHVYYFYFMLIAGALVMKSNLCLSLFVLLHSENRSHWLTFNKPPG